MAERADSSTSDPDMIPDTAPALPDLPAVPALSALPIAPALPDPPTSIQHPEINTADLSPDPTATDAPAPPALPAEPAQAAAMAGAPPAPELLPDEFFKVERHRLDSYFQKMFVYDVHPRDLAKWGFYRVGNGQNSRCAFCRLELQAWEPGNDVLEEHRRWSPSCPFVQGAAVGNVPLGQDSTITLPASAPAQSGDHDQQDEPDITCKVCRQEVLGIVFEPCHHMAACINCAPLLNACPMCHQTPTSHMRVFYDFRVPQQRIPDQ